MPSRNTPPVSQGGPPRIAPTEFLTRHGAVLTWCGLLIVFAADLAFPTGYTVPLLYVPLVLLGSGVPRRHFALYLATAATVLTMLDIPGWIRDADLRVALVNRALTIAVLWTSATAMLMYRRSVERHGESLRTLEDMKQALDQSAIVATTDVPGKIKFANDKFCEISKYSRSELLGQDHRILNSGFHSQEFIRDLWRTIAQGHVWRGELRNRAKDGSFYWVDTTIVPFLDNRGRPWQYMAIRYDITARKEQEQRLRDQTALAALGEFSAVVAHEVRNPLAGIRNGVQLIASELPRGSDSTSLGQEIVARIDSLNGVIEDLLTFARPREFKATDIAVDALVSEVTSAFKQDPSMTEVHVDVLADETITVQADANQLRLVFTNLLVNAAQAMDGRGRITVTVSRSADGGCAIAIADRGPGIPEELRARAFEPFFTTKVRGTGLGLPTVKRIIDAHHGSIAVAENPSGGAMVRVVLPRSQPPSAV